MGQNTYQDQFEPSLNKGPIRDTDLGEVNKDGQQAKIGWPELDKIAGERKNIKFQGHNVKVPARVFRNGMK